MFIRLWCRLVIINYKYSDDATHHVDYSQYGASYDNGAWRGGHDRRDSRK